MPSPIVGASDRIRISRAGCADGMGRSGACKELLRLSHNVAGKRAVAQGAIGNGVLPIAQCRSSNPRGFRSRVMPGLDPGIHRLQESWIAGSSPAMTNKGIVEVNHGDP